MKVYLFFCCVAVLHLSSLCSAQLDEESAEMSITMPIATYDNATMWRNWIFSACIDEIYKGNEDVKKDTRYAMYAYFELGSGLDIYHQLSDLLDEYLQGTPYRALTNLAGEPVLLAGEDTIKLMKCIDFYLSDELHNFIAHYEELSALTSSMWEAIQNKDMTTLRVLFEGKDVSDKQLIIMTADILGNVVAEDNFEAIRTLIEIGVDPDAESVAHGGGLYWVFSGNHDYTRHLTAMLQGGLSPNYKRSTGDMLIHSAVLSAPASTKPIIDRSTNKQEQKKQKSSKPKKNAYLGLVPLLIDSGADVNALNNREQTALDYALEQNKTDLAFYLIDRGAKFSDRSAEIIYSALYMLEARSELYTDFIQLRNLMTQQGITWSPPMPDSDAK